MRSEITLINELRVLKQSTLYGETCIVGENPIREQAMHEAVERIRGNIQGSEFVISMFRTSRSGNVFALELEYCPGGDFLKAIQGKSLPTLESVKIFTQACQAVRFLHAHDIVHRDISPENILLSSRGDCRLADFGMACTVAQHDFLQDGRFCGKLLYYRSPEQYLRSPYSGKASDVFALGVSLFALLTNRVLFRRARVDDSSWQHFHKVGVSAIVEEWCLTEKVSCSACDLLSKMLCPEPNRIAIETVLEHPFLQNT